ncbi:uncharacterized protein LOC142335435 [Convolutriloba macropyga]|uniref:uncharacterized protein LOC142335435 n=1 Tax=Convolutriloba macropyga TaxID=536237 RepID=UPI003F51BD38
MNVLWGSSRRCWMPSLCTVCILALTVTSSVLGRRDEGDNKREECLYSHPQSQFCMSDFVMRATVDKIIKSGYDNSSGEWEQKLKFRVQRVYKSPVAPPLEWPDRKMVKIWVYNTQPLSKGKDYLISGQKIFKRRISLNIFEPK